MKTFATKLAAEISQHVRRNKSYTRFSYRPILFSVVFLLLHSFQLALAQTPACSDDLDNDGDGLIDWQLDLGCTGPDDDTEGGINNDLDSGWSVFEPAADTRIIYVSSSMGSDDYSGLAPEWDGVDGPKASAAAGAAELRQGMPDWLLFRRGDVWVDQSVGIVAGRSELEPSILGSYGDSIERPRFEVQSTWLNIAGGSPAHIRVLGAHVTMVSRDPDDARFNGLGGNCIRWVAGGGDLLIEDVRCDYGQVNLEGEPSLPIALRRNILNGSYSLNSHAQSIFSSVDAPLLLEENVFNHGGWNSIFRVAWWEPETDLAAWNVIESGHFRLNLSGTTFDIQNVDLTSATTMTEVAAILEAEANANIDMGSIQIIYSAGGALQLRTQDFPSGLAYGVSQIANDDNDLSRLFNPNAQGSTASTVFNRNMYLAYGFGNTIVRGNIDANGASGGLQLRMGGICEDNLFLRNPVAIVVGTDENAPNEFVGGSISNNVILGGRDVDTQVQGTGIIVRSVADVGGGHSRIRDLVVNDNIIANQRLGSGNIVGLAITGDGLYENVTVHRNIIYDWARENWMTDNILDQRAYGMRFWISGASDVEVNNNIVQQPNGGFIASTENSAAGITLSNNRFWSAAPNPPDIWSRGWFWLNGSSATADEWEDATGETGRIDEQVDFLDPDRSIESYASSLGLAASYDAYINSALGQSRFNWNADLTAEAVNSYIRQGFRTTLFSDRFEASSAP